MQRAITILAAVALACAPGEAPEQGGSSSSETDGTAGASTTTSPSPTETASSNASVTETVSTTLPDPSESSGSTTTGSSSEADASETAETESSAADSSETATRGSSSSGGSVGVCGDGIEFGAEECDDGDLENFDGCSAACNIESDVVQLSAGANHTCAVFANEEVKCWGGNSSGQLGHGHTDDVGDEPGEMGGALPQTETAADAVFMAHASFFNQCAVLSGGQVKCWGRNTQGALGLGDTENRGDDPDEMGMALAPLEFDDDVTTLWNGCVRTANSAVRCWGGNGGGLLGIGDAENRGDEPGEMGALLPVVELGMGELVQVARGGGHRCAVDDVGRVKCWGDNSAGQLGLGDTDDRGDDPGEMGDALPFVDLGNEAFATRVAGSAAATCALLDSGEVKCWGANDYWLMPWAVEGDYYGDQPEEMGDALPSFALDDGLTAIDLQMGLYFACVLFDEGSVKCWGANSAGALGQETDAAFQGPVTDLPVIDLGSGAEASQLAVGWGGHVCVLLDSGRVKCWGDNSAGALGLEDSLHRGDEPGEMGEALPALRFF